MGGCYIQGGYASRVDSGRAGWQQGRERKVVKVDGEMNIFMSSIIINSEAKRTRKIQKASHEHTPHHLHRLT